MWKGSRRAVIGTTGGLLTGIGATAIFTQDTSAAELDGNFTVSDASKEITNPLAEITLTANGSFSIESDVRPSSAVLRLELKKNTEFEQLAAEQYDQLSKDHTQDFNLQSSIDSHSRITTTNLNPDIGETESLSLTARLALSISHEGETIANETYSDTFTIEISKTRGDTQVSMESTGEITIDTSEQ